MESVARAIAYARAHRERFLEDLSALVRFPTVGAQPARRADLQACARWLGQHLRGIGLRRVAVAPTRRHPMVYADHLSSPRLPTLLFYGHYDVQPVEPLDAWQSPPFQPRREGEYLYGRGTADDKGQLFVHLKAIECFLRTAGAPPVNVKILLEGDEEVGSPTLRPFLLRHRRQLAADAVVVSDTRMLGRDRPTLVYGLRGQLALEVVVEGCAADLHAGNFGGAVPGAARALAWLLASLHTPQGRIAVPGFYDGVREIDARERAFMRAAGPTDSEITRAARARAATGEPGYTAYERTTIRPTIEISGLKAGYTGAGPKAIIPAKAMARLDVRLVAAQTPPVIEAAIRHHLEATAPVGVRVTVRRLGSAQGVRIDRSHPALEAAFQAATVAFRRRPRWIRSGGTIGAVEAFHSSLGLPTILLGFALPDSHIHAPNERLHLPTFGAGIHASIELMARLGAPSRLGGDSVDRQRAKAS